MQSMTGWDTAYFFDAVVQIAAFVGCVFVGYWLVRWWR